MPAQTEPRPCGATYHGFRYARVDEWPPGSEPTADDFTALVLSSEHETPAASSAHTGRSTSSSRTSTVHKSRTSSRYRPTAHSEKAGWTGDIAVFGRTGALNRNIAPSSPDGWGCRADQLDNGRIPCVVPVSSSYNAFFMRPTHGSAAWADACVDVPWTPYLHYGDHRVLENTHHVSLDRRANTAARATPVKADPRTHIGSGRHREHVIDSGFQWAGGSRQAKPHEELAWTSSPTC